MSIIAINIIIHKAATEKIFASPEGIPWGMQFAMMFAIQSNSVNVFIN